MNWISSKMFAGPQTLLWLLPVTYGSIATAIVLSLFVTPQLFNNKLLFDLAVPACVVAPFGGWWAIYQCVRHESQPWRYIAIVVFVPLGFTWYYFERYRRSGRMGQP